MATSSTSASRILVFLKKSQESRATKAHFTQCILDYFGSQEETFHVSLSLRDNKVFLTDDKEDSILIKHPSFCPAHCLKEEDYPNIPDDILERGIDVGVASLLCTSDRKILLTRRAAHLRTFPGIWVPPGGHVEMGETLQQAGLRELAEETGLDLDGQECNTHPIALWESCYPAMLSAGLPKRHHVILYQSIHVPQSHQTLQQKLNPCVNEVGAAAWFDEEVVRILAAHPRIPGVVKLPVGVPKSFTATVIDPESRKPSVEDLDSKVLFNTMPSAGKDTERVSTGTLFALQQWCLLNPSR